MTDAETLATVRDAANRDAILRLIEYAYTELKAEKSTERKWDLTREQILGRLAKREVAFRLVADCMTCVYYKPDKFGAYKCENAETEETCRAWFERWMKEDAE